MRVLLAVSLSVLAAACASSPAPSSTNGSQPVPPPVLSEPTSVERALATAQDLYSKGNPFAAVSRLTQELGNPLNTDEERVKLLMARAEMRAGDASDLLGALADLDAAETISPDPVRQSDIADLKLRIEALNEALASGETPRSGRFEILFALGKHTNALELLMEGGVTANPLILRGMYQIGYLCEGPGYTGAAFDIVDGDGTARTVRFCDSGK